MDLKVTTAVATGLKDEDRKRDILMNAREEGLRVHSCPPTGSTGAVVYRWPWNLAVPGLRENPGSQPVIGQSQRAHSRAAVGLGA